MDVVIENDSQFATYLYQTSSKSSMKFRPRILETLKIPCFLKTTGLNIDVFNMLQIRVEFKTWDSSQLRDSHFSRNSVSVRRS